MTLSTIESEQAEEAKQKKLDNNTKPPEPSTPDYAAGLTPMTQPTKVLYIHLSNLQTCLCLHRSQLNLLNRTLTRLVKFNRPCYCTM